DCEYPAVSVVTAVDDLFRRARDGAGELRHRARRGKGTGGSRWLRRRGLGRSPRRTRSEVDRRPPAAPRPAPLRRPARSGRTPQWDLHQLDAPPLTRVVEVLPFAGDRIHEDAPEPHRVIGRT